MVPYDKQKYLQILDQGYMDLHKQSRCFFIPFDLLAQVVGHGQLDVLQRFTGTKMVIMLLRFCVA
jgi:hypothetical protein